MKMNLASYSTNRHIFIGQFSNESYMQLLQKFWKQAIRTSFWLYFKWSIPKECPFDGNGAMSHAHIHNLRKFSRIWKSMNLHRQELCSSLIPISLYVQAVIEAEKNFPMWKRRKVELCRKVLELTRKVSTHGLILKKCDWTKQFRQADRSCS